MLLYIAVPVPDFQCLLDITKILQKTDVTLNFRAVTLINNTHNFDMEIQRCINDLTAIENYSAALELACCAGLNSSEIILAQVISSEIYQEVKHSFYITIHFSINIMLFSVSKYF